MSPLIALVGPPNAGKTTLFNALTGTGARPVNYPGATVEYAVGATKRMWGAEFRVADTPGVYSLSPKSPEEKVTLEILQGHSIEKPSALLAVADATQLSRHLPLVRQLIETRCPVVLAVTMTDLLEKDGVFFDAELLSKQLGIPVFATQARENRGLEKLVLETQRLSLLGRTTETIPVWSPKYLLKKDRRIPGSVIKGKNKG
jgi:ferrous iron transport protein B